MQNNTDLMQFDLKDGRRITVDFLNIDSLLTHKNDMLEIKQQLEVDFPKALKKNMQTMINFFSSQGSAIQII